MRRTSVRGTITREVKRFTTPVACRLGQARVRKKERERKRSKREREEREKADHERRQKEVCVKARKNTENVEAEKRARA